MSPEQAEKARQLAAAPWFRWQPGMMASACKQYIVGRVVTIDDDGYACWDEGRLPFDAVPDLDDPGTVGWLFTFLVRRQPTRGWGISFGCDVGWRATSCEHDIHGDTMGEAVANALLLVGGLP